MRKTIVVENIQNSHERLSQRRIEREMVRRKAREYV
jgi:hypothetical protein